MLETSWPVKFELLRMDLYKKHNCPKFYAFKSFNNEATVQKASVNLSLNLQTDIFTSPQQPHST